MDDLEHGLECLLGDFLPEDRQRLADKIASDLVGIDSDAARALVFETQRFAAHGGDGASARAAFRRFAVDDGPAIGRRQQASEAARRSAGIRAAGNADRHALQLAWITRALADLRPRPRSAEHAATLILRKIASDPGVPDYLPRSATQVARLVRRAPNLADIVRKKSPTAR
jgi:hypothetical protein